VDARVKQSRDVRVREPSQYLRFAQEPLAQGTPGEIRVECLDRDLAFVEPVVAAREPDLAHAALSNLVEDAVGAEARARLQCVRARRLARLHEAAAGGLLVREKIDDQRVQVGTRMCQRLQMFRAFWLGLVQKVIHLGHGFALQRIVTFRGHGPFPSDRFSSYRHMFAVAATFSDSMAPEPMIVNGLAFSALIASRGRPRASLPNT
jgi:hypothetical protein